MMTNEEKILEILGVMHKDIGELKTDVKKLDTRVSNLEATVAENSLMIKAMKTNLEMMDAKLDNLRATTASVHQVRELKRTIGEQYANMSRELLA